MNNDLNAEAREFNYISHIQYVTEIIVNIAIVYAVGPRNRFIVHHREVNEIAAREIIHLQRTLRNDDEANENYDVFCDFDVIERRFKCKIKQLLTSKGNELDQTLLNSVKY